MFQRTLAALSLASLAACSSSAPTPPPPTKVNACATPGKTYLSHFVEQAGGTCGPLADVLVTVNADGTLPGPAVSCESRSEIGCRTQATACTTSAVNGLTCHVTSDLTYASDGSTAAGTETASCSGASSTCTSTYQITVTRQ
ncbi:MAG TPA: hypothetical protein VF316_19260 [Polyangiaceae bacterium]